MPRRDLPDTNPEGPPMTLSVFQAGEPVIVTSGLFHGRRGIILGLVREGDIALVNVDLDGIGQVFFRSSVLMKIRSEKK